MDFDEPHTTPSTVCSKSRKVAVRLLHTVQLPCRSECEVVAATDEEVSGNSWIMVQKPNMKYPGVYVARALVRPVNKCLIVRLLNSSNEQVTLYEKMHIAVLEEPVEET